MKKFFFVILIFLCMSAMVFSDEWRAEERWLSIGANFGNYFEDGSDLGDFHVGSPGLNLSGYSFSNHRNIGFFFNFGVLFPVMNSIESNYNPTIQADFLLGPGFRFNITDRFRLYCGAGLNVNLLTLYDRESVSAEFLNDKISFGIGGDVGVKFDFTNAIFINVGSTVSYNFAAYNFVETNKVASGWIDGYSMIGIRPYVGIGFNFYSRSKWGKP